MSDVYDFITTASSQAYQEFMLIFIYVIAQYLAKVMQTKLDNFHIFHISVSELLVADCSEFLSSDNVALLWICLHL